MVSNVPGQADTVDPFLGTVQQTKQRYRAYINVNVAGKNVTRNIEPFLISAKIVDGKPLNCELELDDRDGRLPIPSLFSPLSAEIGWAAESLVKVFSGVITEIEHGFGRKSGGRRMWIKGSGMNPVSAIKSPVSNVLGKGAEPGGQEGQEKHSLSDWIQFATGAIGASATVAPLFSSIMRDRWDQQTEGAGNLVERLGQQFGAFTRVIDGTHFQFLDPNQQYGGTVFAKWGDNLIAYRVTPQAARPRWQGANQMYYNTQLGQWLKEAGNFSFGGNLAGAASAIFALPAPASTQQNAQQDNDGAERQGGMNIGEGRIVINGEPRAQWLGVVEIVGVRPGVDGPYKILSAEHNYSRQGYTTLMEVLPQFAAAGQASVPGGGSPL